MPMIDFREQIVFDFWSNLLPLLCPRFFFFFGSEYNSTCLACHCTSFQNDCNCFPGINVTIHMD